MWTSRIAGASADSTDVTTQTQYAGTQDLDPELVAAIEKQFGFDKPIHERYFKMLGDYMTFDLGQSYFQNRPVTELIWERLPVSISLGLWSMLLIYSISDPAWCCKSRTRRHPVRRLDERDNLCRLRSAEFSICDLPDRAICRWVLSRSLSAEGTHIE